MDHIKIFAPGSAEHLALTRAAALMTGLSPNGWRYFVGDTYFDFGQGWLWTTILCEHSSDAVLGCFQAINPAIQKSILQAESAEELLEIAKAYFLRDLCLDTLKSA